MSSARRGGTKKFGMCLETRETKLFGRDIVGFCLDIPAVPKKFESADRTRGWRKGATPKNDKNHQNVSNIFSTLFDNFSQKASRNVKIIFDTFRAAPIFRPLFGASD